MVLAVVDDLLLSSKIRAAARSANRPLVFVRDTSIVVGEIRARRPDLVIVDLDLGRFEAAEVIRDIKAAPDLPQVRVIGFVSHVHADRIQIAREAGVDAVMARSAFFSSLPELLAATPASSTPS